MTNQAQISERIAKAQQAGFKDSDIYSTLANDKGFSARIQQAKKSGFSDDQIAQQLGLKLNQPKQQKQQEFKPEEPGALVKFGHGMATALGGVVQAEHWIGDKVKAQANKHLGTNFDTNGGEKYTREMKAAEEEYQASRQATGDNSIDGWSLVGELAATAPVGAAAKGFQGVRVLSKAGSKVLAQNAAVGGAVGAAQFAENTDERLSHIGMGATGGAVGGVLVQKGTQGVSKAVQKIKNSRTNVSNVDQIIEPMLSSKGINLSELPQNALDEIRKSAVTAVRSGRKIDEGALVRQAKLGELGIKGTQAQITRNPKQWQQEAELSKTSAGDKIRDKYVKDNQDITQLLEDASTKTGGVAHDQYGAMQSVINAASKKLENSKANYKGLYEKAYQAPGNDIQLNGAGFTNDAITALDKSYALSSLPPSVGKILKDISQNSERFTLGKSEELVKILNREYKASLNNGQPSSSTHAIGIVRDALNGRRDEAMQGLISNGNDAAKLYNSARQAFTQHSKMLEQIPLLKDVQKGIEPDKLLSKHVLNADIAKLDKTMRMLNEVDPQALSEIKKQVVDFISKQAIKSNGEMSPAAMQKALDKIGDRKLATMFEPKEIKYLKDIGMAAHFLKSQPPHSNVNHSNTAATLTNFLLDRLSRPGVRVLLSPLKDIKDARTANKILNPVAAGEKIQPSGANETLINQLIKAGILSGANAPQN